MAITPDKIKLIFALLGVFLIPGWTFISVTGLWRRWKPLQRWLVAITTSVAFYPILFYAARAVFPGLHFGFNKNLALLVVFAVLIIVMQWRHWREHFAFDRWEWAAILLFGVTLFSRFWIIRGYPYPAWSDSLHHTLITQLTAQNGQLPFTLVPYSGATLDMYHLGLYALTGVVEQLSGAPAYTALLWTAQIFNGLCAIGIYFILDRFVGRWAGLTGLVVAGLLSFQPAWYVNWGRFTQLASQAVVLMALGVTLELMESPYQGSSKASRLRLATLILLAGGLNAAVFLLHFRVAIYYFPLLAVVVVWQLIKSVKNRQLKDYFSSTLLVGVLSLVLVLPALLPALRAYLEPILGGLSQPSETYFTYTSQDIFTIGLQPWLLVVAVLAGLISLASRHRSLAMVSWVWVALLLLEGNLYRLGVSFLDFTNFSGIMIAFYLPAALLAGLGIQALADRVPQPWQTRFAYGLISALLIAGFIGGYYRSTGIETWRYFMTDYDRQAMEWIKTNTPSDAVFAINTYMWLGGYPHGTDGGYWIPYFTGRQTNAETMMLPVNQPAEMSLVLDRSTAVVNYVNGTGNLQSMCETGLSYLYLGKGNPISTPIDPLLVNQNPLAKLVYQNPGVLIYQLCAGFAAH